MKACAITVAVLSCVILGNGVSAETNNNAPEVSNVTASQRADGSNVVDIYYDLQDADGDACVVFCTISNDGGQTWALVTRHVSGDVGEGVAPGGGKHIVWNVGTDAPGLTGGNFRARIVADDRNPMAEMCFVPAGTFSCSTWDGVADWMQVYLSDYWIDKYEVTNEFYCMFLNAGNGDRWRTDMSSEIEREGVPGAYTYHPVAGYERRPVRWVTWYDAVALCDWRSDSEGLPAGSYHLPTEAQWEKAAGWTPGRTSLWTYAIQSDSISCDKVNYNNCKGTTTDVGYYTNSKSYYGCYDMSGNVWEWCADWYGWYPSSTSDPTGPASGTYRVLRGGLWGSSATYVEVGYRYYDTPSYVRYDYGFRCARTLE